LLGNYTRHSGHLMLCN